MRSWKGCRTGMGPALLYLWRIGDRQAATAVVRAVMADLSFGGCCCTKARAHEEFFCDGVEDGFWKALAALTPQHQADVLEVVERHIDGDLESWLEARDAYLQSHVDTRAEFARRSPEPEAELGPAEQGQVEETRDGDSGMSFGE